MKSFQFKSKETFDQRVSLLPFNRKASYRPDLALSMQKFGFIHPVVLILTNIIDGVERLYLIDGRHRVITAGRLGIPIDAVLVKHNCKTTEELVELIAYFNSTQKAWTIENYVEAFASLGKSVYKRLQQITVDSMFSMTTIAMMLYGFRSRGYVSNETKNGKFKINELQATFETLRVAGLLTAISGKTLTNRQGLALHYVMKLEIWNEKKFLETYKYKHKCLVGSKIDNFSDLFISWLKE